MEGLIQIQTFPFEAPGGIAMLGLDRRGGVWLGKFVRMHGGALKRIAWDQLQEEIAPVATTGKKSGSRQRKRYPA
jgi:hypothetical protein